MDDTDLLDEYARTGAESAFTELVNRHLGLVYSAAHRQLRDAQLAQDVTQAVFVVLARKAKQVSRHPGLSGWLLQTTRYAVNAHIRAAVRRAHREQEAVMQADQNNSPPAPWIQLQPHLDEAMASLSDTDRAVLAMRYFENKPAHEIARVLKLNEETAQKRANRALEKLRKYFGKRGIAISGGTIAAAVSANAVQTVPAGVATAVITSPLSESTATLASLLATTKATTMTTLQYITVTTALTATVGAGIYEARVASRAQADVLALREQQGPLDDQIRRLQNDLFATSNQLAIAQHHPAASAEENPELLKLRGDVGALRNQMMEADNKANAAEQKLAAFLALSRKFDMDSSARVNALKQMGLAARIVSNDNGNQYPTNLYQLATSLNINSNIWQLGGVDLFAFDFVNVGSVNFDRPNMVAMRERYARQAPDGTWQRLYGMVDGRVITATSYDGNFQAWEKANTDEGEVHGQ